MSAKIFAWNTMKGKWGYGVGVSLLFFLLTIVPGALQEILTNGDNGISNAFLNAAVRLMVFLPNPYLGALAIFAACSIVLGLVAWATTFGVAACFFDIANNTPHSYKRLFTAFRSAIYFVKVILIEFLVNLFTALWSLLLIVPGIMKYYSYSMAELFLVDHPEYTPIQAIDESKKMMQGHRMELFRLQVEFLPWFLLVIVTLGIAALWVMPYYSTAKAKFYLDLKG